MASQFKNTHFENEVIVIGYSGHGYVAIDLLLNLGYVITGYCDLEKKDINPYNILYMGPESDLPVLEKLKKIKYFISIGSNHNRQRVYLDLKRRGIPPPINIIHSSAVLSNLAVVGHGVMIAAQSTINSGSIIGAGTICNTGSIIEHDCEIGDFVHIAPGATLTGGVKAGERTFIGANAVIKDGVKIGRNVIIGAGAVVIRDIPDNKKAVGNPARIIN